MLDKTIKLWHLDIEEELKTLSGHTVGVSEIAFSPVGVSLPSGIGQTLVSGSADKTVKL